MSVIATRPISCRSAPNSAPGSPNNRPKFLCSHGGKILPRPGDGQLKYVGGETRVISVPRDITLQELMKKLTYLVDGEMILKYQILSEDLDALVSVKSDEDLRHMFDEIDRYESAGSPRLRTFLFPVNPVTMENPSGSMGAHALEQRYIDSINGIIRSTPIIMKQRPAISTIQHGSLVSSACSSPRTPDSSTGEAMNNQYMFHSNYPNGRTGMHKVRSSPNLSSLKTPLQSSHCTHQLHPQHNRQAHHPSGYQSLKPPIDSHKSGAPERLISLGSVGRAEGLRYQLDPGLQHYYHASRQNRGSGCCTNMHYDDYCQFSDTRIFGTGSRTASPIALSPRYSLGGMKAWDGTIGM